MSNSFITTDQSVQWAIIKESITPPSIQGEFTYDTYSHSPTISSYDDTVISVGGTITATNAGEYEITLTLLDSDNQSWRNGSTVVLKTVWKIKKAKVTIPTVTTSFTYDKSSKTVIGEYDTNLINVSGDITKTNAGDYEITLSLADSDNYEWTDGTTDDKVISWKIDKASVTIPTVSGSYPYDRSEKSATISEYDSTLIAQSGTIFATSGGIYTVYFDLVDSDNYEWSDKTITQKSGTWEITTASILEVPTVTSDLVFNASVQSPTITNIDSENISVSGNSQTDAGDYVVIFTLTHPESAIWSDGTSRAKTADWSIERLGLEVPTVTGDYTYDGESHEPQVSEYDTRFIRIIGDMTGINVGTYDIEFELTYKDSTYWIASDGVNLNYFTYTETDDDFIITGLNIDKILEDKIEEINIPDTIHGKQVTLN